MTILENTLLRDIDVEALPRTNSPERLITLPGAPPLAHPTDKLPENKVTFNQQYTDARWAKANLDASMTWAQAAAEMRKRFLRGNQPDFQITERIMEQLRAENADRDLSARQLQTASDMVAALAGTAPHFDAAINAKIQTTSAAVRQKCLTIWMDVCFAGTQGTFNRAIALSNGVFGRVTPRSALGAPIFADVGEGENVENTGENAPY